MFDYEYVCYSGCAGGRAAEGVLDLTRGRRRARPLFRRIPLEPLECNDTTHDCRTSLKLKRKFKRKYEIEAEAKKPGKKEKKEKNTKDETALILEYIETTFLAFLFLFRLRAPPPRRLSVSSSSPPSSCRFFYSYSCRQTFCT